jgi:16S rRNA processing protein RimM
LSSDPEFVAIARIIRPQGRRGEVLAEILTDFPEKFSERKHLWIRRDGGRSQRMPFALESHWFHKGRAVLKFLGTDTISDAEKLSGAIVEIPRASRAPLPPGRYYVSDLVGSTLLDLSGDLRREIGTIEDVQQPPGQAPLLIVSSPGGHYEIPLAEAYLVRFDGSARTLEMCLPAGLLDVNAPLSPEEKREQRRKAEHEGHEVDKERSRR